MYTINSTTTFNSTIYTKMVEGNYYSIKFLCKPSEIHKNLVL